MMRGVIALLPGVLAACGRLGFDPGGAGSDATIDGHDEDGDGVTDVDDVCPHVSGSQLDTDNDGVGDDCDWEPSIPRQHFALVTTMKPGQPFSINQGNFSQSADALHFDGVGYGELAAGLVAGDIEIDIGIDIMATVGTGTQHQIAVSAQGGVAIDYAELNEVLPSFSNVAITRFDGATFVVKAGSTLPSLIHPGAFELRVLLVRGGAATVDAGWPGEPYHLVLPNTVYTGATEVTVKINNLILDVRYVVVITGS